MSKRAFAVVVAMVVALAPISVSARAYVPNRAMWLQLSNAQRSGYAIGAFDASTLVFEGDADSQANAFGLLECSDKLHLSSDDLVKLITDQYERDPQSWATPANAVLFTQLQKACGTYIDARRKAAGLPVGPK